MNHVTEVIAGTLLLVAATVGAMFVMPKPKPEPPQTQAETTQEALKRCEKEPTRMCVVRVEADAEKTDRERVEQLEKEVGAINVEQRALIEEVKALTERVKKK